MRILLYFSRDNSWCKGIPNWFLKCTRTRNNLSIILTKLPMFFPYLFKKAWYWQSKLGTWQIKLRITLPGTVFGTCLSTNLPFGTHGSVVKISYFFQTIEIWVIIFFYIIPHSRPGMHRLGNTCTWLDRAAVGINIPLYE